ncbi:MAG: hypothetical protein CMF59_11865 [Leptospiraceae bacterium]|nr:hypothetical protein [Leptospiraceae bacterium]
MNMAFIRARLKPASVLLSMIAGIAILGAVIASSLFIYSPMVERRCIQSCSSMGTGEVRSGYVATSIGERCECKGSDGFQDGYIFFENSDLDWFVLMLIRVTGVGLLILLVLLPIGKLITRIERS